MCTSNNNIKSSIIVSVYKDDTALRLILNSLLNQSVKNFEIIISEDCQSTCIKECVNTFRELIPNIQHLSQKDNGFRKNIALNRAISATTTDHIIFIDGDCIPHRAFIEAHQEFAGPGYACAGRRLELGEKLSKKLRTNKIRISSLTNIIFLLLDKPKNIESGIYSKILHRLTINKKIQILGCNFSCSKKDLLTINGFNIDYLAPGIGEDSDIDWRLSKLGVAIKNVKFSAIQYHLYHPRMYSTSDKNLALFNKTKQSGDYTCLRGIKNIIK